MRQNFVLAMWLSCIILVSCNLNKDLAGLDSKNEWSHHFAFGSPSWDSFQRFPNNPVYTGHVGMEWPVNGFLFDDPLSKNWYLYIGEYRRNYAIIQDSASKNFNCTIYKSSDRGRSWKKTGDLFPLNMKCYDSLRIEAPDVMVIFDQGKYHMIFDWVSSNSSWTKMGQSGIGYAVSDNPEGPFKVSSKPLKINSQYQNAPILNKYWRMYAPMIVRRATDWVILYMMDTAPPRSWALAASTSQHPDGPYSDPVLIKNVEGKINYPPLMEYFPAFTNDGYVYFPATSVAINRNYQLINRVKKEDITVPEKWEVFSAGSFWHSTTAPNEYAGIWGQTVTGFVDENDTLVLMYPSKTKENFGTINLAKTSFSHLNNESGFTLSACENSSFTWIKKGINPEKIISDFDLTGTMHIVWDFHKPIEIMDGWGKHSFYENKGDFKEIEISGNHWKLKYVRDTMVQILDSGKVQNPIQPINHLEIIKQTNSYRISVNNQEYVTEKLCSDPGVIGIILDQHSTLKMKTFKVSGKQNKGRLFYGYYEALLNSGNQDKDWEFINDPMFRSGKGAVSKLKSACAKWNFEGTGFKLWLPKGPKFGTVLISIDGLLAKRVNLKTSSFSKSTVVFQSKSLTPGAHAIHIESQDGNLPVDCLEVLF